MTEQSYYFISTGARGSMFTLNFYNSRVIGCSNPYSYIRNLSTTEATAIANAKKYLSGVGNDFPLHEEITFDLRPIRKGKRCPVTFAGGKHMGKTIEEVAKEGHIGYLVYMANDCVFGWSAYHKDFFGNLKAYLEDNADLVTDLRNAGKDEFTLNFGKHKGLTVDEIMVEDASYMDWLYDVDSPSNHSAFQGHVQAKLDAVRASQPVSEHVGAVKERILVHMTHVRSAGYDSDYGWISIVTMQDDQGNIFLYRGAGDHLRADESGMVKCTVKEHDEYQGVKQTVVQRCIVTLDPQGE